MTSLKTIASLFEKEPPHWGLRGDPHLWNEIRTSFEQTPLPDSAEELIALIQTMFTTLTGHSISERTMFFIERFSHGGMSSGHISPDFWRDEVIPMMHGRFIEVKSKSNE